MAVNPFRVVGGFFGRFFGNTIGEAAAFGIGGALREPLHPLLQELTNATWEAGTKAGVSKPPDAYTLASGVAQGQVPDATARTWAAQNGIGDDQFTALIDIANVGPGVAAAFELWRRDVITEPGFRRAVKRLGLEQEWIDDLVKIKQHVLDPAVIATAVQRGLLPNAGILPVGPPTAVGKVPPMPMVDLDPFIEAAGSGVEADRLKVLARIVGLPASPDLAARMVFRGIIDRDDFDRAISEGNTRNEWAPFLFDGFREIPTAHQGIEYRLRGWTDDAGMYAQTARHGMSKADTDLLFKVSGRPISFRQVFIGERRGGTYNGSTAAINPAFLKSLQESNIRPEWYDLAWAQRHTYPSAFVLRALTQDHTLTQVESEDILLRIGWEPKLATLVSTKWYGGTGPKADPIVKSEQTRLRTATHKSYVAQESDDATASAALAAAGVDAAVIPEVLALWQHERGLIRAQLSPADVRKAYQQADLNAATGAAWTRDEAFTALLDRGWGATDANDYLNIPYKG